MTATTKKTVALPPLHAHWHCAPPTAAARAALGDGRAAMETTLAALLPLLPPRRETPAGWAAVPRPAEEDPDPDPDPDPAVAR